MHVYQYDPDHQAEYEAAVEAWEEHFVSQPDDLFTLTET